MSLTKSLSIAFLTFAVLAGMMFLRLNASRIRDLMQVFAIRNGLMAVEMVQLPPENNSADNATGTAAGEVNTRQAEKTVASADIPEKLSPVKENISMPPVSEMPALTPGQVSGNGALTRAGVVQLTNKQRQTYLGVGFSLAENSQLDAAAASKVKDMFA